MTNKEAIDYLKRVRQTITLESVSPLGYYSDSVPYINQAIKALEREETCENMDDHYMMFECSACGGRSIECMMNFNYCPNCGRKVEETK